MIISKKYFLNTTKIKLVRIFISNKIRIDGFSFFSAKLFITAAATVEKRI